MASGDDGYEVFARRRRGDPLQQIGTVTAPSDTLARAYARWVYDEETWVEVALVRRQHLVPVTAFRPAPPDPA